MGLNFRKSIQLIPGVKLNLSKSGASISAGVPGFRKSINTQGQVTTTASIPGTGLYYTDKKKAFGKDAKTAKKAAEKQAAEKKTTKKSTPTAEKNEKSRFFHREKDSGKDNSRKINGEKDGGTLSDRTRQRAAADRTRIYERRTGRRRVAQIDTQDSRRHDRLEGGRSVRKGARRVLQSGDVGVLPLRRGGRAQGRHRHLSAADLRGQSAR